MKVGDIVLRGFERWEITETNGEYCNLRTTYFSSCGPIVHLRQGTPFNLEIADSVKHEYEKLQSKRFFNLCDIRNIFENTCYDIIDRRIQYKVGMAKLRRFTNRCLKLHEELERKKVSGINVFK